MLLRQMLRTQTIDKVLLQSSIETGTIEDVPVASVKPDISSVSNARADEGDTLSFTVNLSARTTQSETYYYSTYQGTATSLGSSRDYEGATDRSISVRSGEGSFTIDISTLSDVRAEGNEDFHLYVTASDAVHPFGRQGLPQSNIGTGTIENVPVASVKQDISSVVIDGVCDRTMQVRDWIVEQIPGIDNCVAVTAEHLADISGDMDLSSRGINGLQEGDFLGLSVNSLNLSVNALESLPAGVFSGLSISGTLRLDNNRLRSLPAGVFSGLSVSSLLLTANALETLPAGVFSGLSVSVGLWLNNSGLESLPAGVFSGLSVIDLRLDNNELETLPAGVFSGLSISGALSLRGNELESLPAGVFSGLSISALRLDNNRLETLPAGIFSGLSVSSLLLTANALESLPAGVFSGLSVSDHLDLDNNRLETLLAGIFSGLSVRHLWLSNNQLESLPAGVFSGLIVLNTLRLDNNPGAPFLLTVEQERMNGIPTATGPAEVILKLIEGASFEIPVPLAVSSGGTLSSSRATLVAGSTASGPFTVTGSSAVTVTLGDLPPLPSGYQGLQLVGSAPLVLFGADTTRPGVSSAAITSVPASGQTYAAGEAIEVTLTFDEAVAVDATAGQPGLSLQVGTVTRDALYVSGRGTTALVFRYRVQEGDMDSDGIGWSATALGLNGGSLADRSGNAAVLTLAGQAAAADHKVVASLLEVSLSSSIHIVKEGETADITVIVIPAPASVLTIHYMLGTDVSVDTDDANNEDYVDSSSLRIAAGASHGFIAIPIVDDGMVEPSREVFTITLDKPESSARYTLGSLTTATITIVVIDGVCDRTMQVRDWIVEQILGVDDCAAVTAGHLAGISGDMDLGGRGISALQEGDFLGLSVNGFLSLRDNALETLPVGVFSGLSVSRNLRLDNNQLESLPAEVFSGLSVNGLLYLRDNGLETLPAGVFSGLRAGGLDLANNALETLPAGVFSGLIVGFLSLYNNQLESLPAGDIFWFECSRPASVQ